MPSVTSASVAVSLPGGLATDEGEWLRDAELCPITGQEEDWLIRNPKAPSAVTVSRLLHGCLLSVGDRPATPSMIDRLLVGDRDFLMLELRRLTLGESFFAVVACPACDEKMDVSFKADDIPVEGISQSTDRFTLELMLAGRKRSVTYRLPNGADQEAVLKLPHTTAGEAILQACLVDNGGIELNEKELVILAEAIERSAPKVELELDLTCPSCDHSFVLPFDTTAFFLQELRSNDRSLLYEFHNLAFHYHWSHTEILGLDRERRRTYLSLLTDELRQN